MTKATDALTGFGAQRGPKNTVDIYDDASGTWSTATLSVGRTSLAATTVGTKALFAGGYWATVVDVYDDSTGTWSTMNLSVQRGGMAATTVGTKAIFAVANNPKASDPSQLRMTIANIHKVIASEPESESVYHTALGRCYFRLGELEQAQKEFSLALVGGAGGPFHRAWIHLRLGCIADIEGDHAAAEAYYTQVLGSADARNHDYQKQLAERFTKKPYRGYAKNG